MIHTVPVMQRKSPALIILACGAALLITALVLFLRRHSK